MNIYVYKNISSMLEKDFSKYSELSKSIFDCSEAEFNLVFEQYSKMKGIIEKHLSQVKPYTSFSESYYDVNISDEETKMILMNGIYSVEEVKRMISKEYLTKEFQKKISEVIKNSREDDKIMFWNAE